jgi:hypothetical protein
VRVRGWDDIFPALSGTGIINATEVLRDPNRVIYLQGDPLACIKFEALG